MLLTVERVPIKGDYIFLPRSGNRIALVDRTVLLPPEADRAANVFALLEGSEEQYLGLLPDDNLWTGGWDVDG